MENQPAVPLARRPAPRRPPPLLLHRRAWRSCRRRSTSPLAGDLLPAMAPRGNPPRPPARKEGGGGRAKKGRDGARGGRRHLPSRTSRPPDPAAAATGRARGRRIWPVPPYPRRAGVRQRRRHGRKLEEGAGEGGVPGVAAPPLCSRSSANARRRGADAPPAALAQERAGRRTSSRRGADPARTSAAVEAAQPSAPPTASPARPAAGLGHRLDAAPARPRPRSGAAPDAGPACGMGHRPPATARESRPPPQAWPSPGAWASAGRRLLCMLSCVEMSR